jgi:hypothetical protein
MASPQGLSDLPLVREEWDRPHRHPCQGVEVELAMLMLKLACEALLLELGNVGV